MVGGTGFPNTKFSEGIENEHCKMAGCDKFFTTSNYLVTTTPRDEYNIATGSQKCPEKDMLDRKLRKVRILHKIDALKTLEICKRAGLKDYEILAVVSLHRCIATLWSA
jgi:hypothetical protein